MFFFFAVEKVNEYCVQMYKFECIWNHVLGYVCVHAPQCD